MALKNLDKATIRQYLTAMWKKELGTRQDPANKKWLEKGAAKGSPGLYGGLTDRLSTALIFDEAQKSYAPSSLIGATYVCENLNGLSPHHTAELSATFTSSTTVSHSTTDSLKVGAGLEFKAKATIFGIGGEATTKFNIEFSHSWTKGTSETKSESHTVKQSVPVAVPAGKVYQVVLSATSQELTVPYRALIYVEGTTETWFEDRVKGHYNWSTDAGTAFVRVAKWGLAGEDSPNYGRDPSMPSRGVITQHGIVTSERTTDFVAKVIDITDDYKKTRAAGTVQRVTGVRQSGVAGRLVKTIPLEPTGDDA